MNSASTYDDDGYTRLADCWIIEISKRLWTLSFLSRRIVKHNLSQVGIVWVDKAQQSRTLCRPAPPPRRRRINIIRYRPMQMRHRLLLFVSSSTFTSNKVIYMYSMHTCLAARVDLPADRAQCAWVHCRVRGFVHCLPGVVLWHIYFEPVFYGHCIEN